MAEGPYPVEVRRLPAERRLRVTWSDGRAREHEYDTLRGWCPCAMCQGHEVIELQFHPPAQPVEPVSIAPVGNYGLSFVWSDGHGSGIYRFDYLRALPAGGDPPEAAQTPTRGGLRHVVPADGDDG